MTELKGSICKLCGEPMPEGEEMFNYHGRSGPCPKLPEKPKATIQPSSLARRYEATGVLLSGKTAYFKYEAVPDGKYVLFTDYSAKCAETDRLREALEKYQWVSVKERLPKEIENGYRWVQVYDKYWETIYDASFDGEKWEPNYDREAESEITHWRPFPPNPPPAAISDCATSRVEAARNPSKQKEKA